MKVQLLDLHAQYAPILDKIKAEVNKVMDQHQYINGPQVKEFEEKTASYLKVKHAIGCASGTDALVLAVKALGIGRGDEVITTPFTFFATASSIYRCGATPVFVDIDPDTYNIDPAQIEKAITSKTKAIMPVHLFGQAADMDKIMEIAKKHNLYVIEDNAQGIGCEWNGQYAATIGDIGTLSFFPSKNLGAMGDAGMCLTNNDELAAKLKQLRMHGETPKYFHKWVGLNSRLDTVQATVLSVKLDSLEGWSEGRRKNAEFYNKHLAGIPQVKTPVIAPLAKSIYNQYTLSVEKRDELLAYLQEHGVGCAIYYPLPLHLQECFAEYNYHKGDLPNSEAAANKVLSIPIYAELKQEELDYVVKTIKEFYQGA